jgi:hypothetical protein
MICNGPCEQGKKQCPCPNRCVAPSDDLAMEALGRFVFVVVAVLMLLAVSAVLWR